MSCGAPHPDHPEWACQANEDRHPVHVHGYGADFVTWPNNTAPPRRLLDLTGVAEQIASVVEPERHTTGDPVAGRADPVNSHIAAERIEPKRGTRGRAVLDYLRAHPDQWIDGSVLASPQVGGGEGKRRFRELRALGWPVETRPSPHSATEWQYRYVSGASSLRNFD